jgi:hypothetical protein
MDFITITIANIIWILYSMSEGIREGFYSFHKNNNRKACEFEPKSVCNMQRFLVLSSSALILFYTMGLIAFPFIIGQIFMFRYFHKIMNESTIKKLEIKRIEMEQNDPVILKKLDKAKEPLVLLGITIQLFTYLFLM